MSEEYNIITELRSPHSVELNPLYFVKKKKFPKGQSFNTKSARFHKQNIFRNSNGPGQYDDDYESLEDRTKKIKLKIKKFSFQNRYMRNSLKRTKNRFGEKIQTSKGAKRLKSLGMVKRAGEVQEFENFDSENIGPYDSGCYDNGSFMFYERLKKQKQLKKRTKSHRILKNNYYPEFIKKNKKKAIFLVKKVGKRERRKKQKKKNLPWKNLKKNHRQKSITVKVEEVMLKPEQVETMSSPKGNDREETTEAELS